jgi:hypothetical protein
MARWLSGSDFQAMKAAKLAGNVELSRSLAKKNEKRPAQLAKEQVTRNAWLPRTAGGVVKVKKAKIEASTLKRALRASVMALVGGSRGDDC